MLAFHITYNSDKKTESFSDLKKITTLLAVLYPENFFVDNPPSLEHQTGDSPPHYSCVQNHCWNLPEKYVHTYTQTFRCKHLTDMSLFSGIYQNICLLSGYTFELVSYS
jgi:hypothetical protein